MEENLLKKKDNKKKNYGILGVLLVAIILIGGVYAFFQYSREGEEPSKLLAGDVWLHYSDSGSTMALNPNAFPETPEEARAEGRTDNIITFDIEGKNTTTNKNIYYEIKLLYADNVEGRTRIKDSDLRFDLEEKIGDTTTRVLENVSFDTINNTRIWVNTVNSGEEVSRSYTLRMWISDDVLISDTAENATYTTGEYKKLFANVKVAVYGDFEEKIIYPTSLYPLIESSLADYLLPDDGEARILSGGGGGDGVSNVPDPDFKNYVWYSGKLWRIVALNNDGSIKLVTQHNITTIFWGANTTFYSEDSEGNITKIWMYEWLNEDFLDTLYDSNNEIIVRNAKWDVTETTVTTKPTNTTKTTSTVGLLTAYEYTQSY